MLKGILEPPNELLYLNSTVNSGDFSCIKRSRRLAACGRSAMLWASTFTVRACHIMGQAGERRGNQGGLQTGRPQTLLDTQTPPRRAEWRQPRNLDSWESRNTNKLLLVDTTRRNSVGGRGTKRVRSFENNFLIRQLKEIHCHTRFSVGLNVESKKKSFASLNSFSLSQF